jgi:taurine dioxygenase
LPEKQQNQCEMPTIKPSGKILGATVEGLNLSRPLSEKNRALIFRSLGTYGVLHFPKQSLDATSLKTFSQRFGTLEIHVANIFQDPENPEVMIQIGRAHV